MGDKKNPKEVNQEGKEEPLRPVREGKAFCVTPCRKGGLAIGVQVRDEPISTRLHVSHSDGVKKTGEKGGKDLKKKVVGKGRGGGTGAFLSVKDYQPHLSFYWFSFDVYGSKGNRHGANPN